MLQVVAERGGEFLFFCILIKKNTILASLLLQFGLLYVYVTYGLSSELGDWSYLFFDSLL